MRRKTILLGLLFIGIVALLISGRTLPIEADHGLNPGEKLPSIMVNGKDLTAEFADEPEAILVVWSVEDATSRVVNSWISNNPEGEKVPVYSICLDAEQQDAEFYALLDNVNPRLTKLWGARNDEQTNLENFRKLTSDGRAMVFHTAYGKIEKAETASSLWQRIQNEMAI